MKELKLVISSLKETETLGRIIGGNARAGDVVVLEGNMGSGKTALAQAIARGLEVSEQTYVTSPSFAILHEYEGRLMMYHMDFYRLGGVEDVLDLGFEDYFYRNGLSVIEWASRAAEILPQEKLTITMNLREDLGRDIGIEGGERYREILKRIDSEF